MTILREYSVTECDEQFHWTTRTGLAKVDGQVVPEGNRAQLSAMPRLRCSRLKAAALAYLLQGSNCKVCCGTGDIESDDSGDETWSPCISCKGAGRVGKREPRCQDCQHPISEEIWEVEPAHLDSIERLLRQGEEPSSDIYVSRCDEKCVHGGAGRVLTLSPHRWKVGEIKDLKKDAGLVTYSRSLLAPCRSANRLPRAE